MIITKIWFPKICLQCMSECVWMSELMTHDVCSVNVPPVITNRSPRTIPEMQTDGIQTISASLISSVFTAISASSISSAFTAILAFSLSSAISKLPKMPKLLKMPKILKILKMQKLSPIPISWIILTDGIYKFVLILFIGYGILTFASTLKKECPTRRNLWSL